MTGRLITVVGPSGVGKDSVIDGIIRARPELQRVRRVITRPADLGGEDYHAVTADQFQTMAKANAFCIHWQAHGLRYGIPAEIQRDITAGKTCIANFSRKALAQAATVFPDILILNIIAAPETLAARLSGRGRESAAQIAARLAEGNKCLPDGIPTVTISNDGALDDAIAQAIAAIQPVRA